MEIFLLKTTQRPANEMKSNYYINYLWSQEMNTNLNAMIFTSEIFVDKDTRNNVDIAWWINSSYSSLSILSSAVSPSKLHISDTTEGRWSWFSFGARRSHTDLRSTTSARHNDTRLRRDSVAIVALLALNLPREEFSKSEITDNSSAPYLSDLENSSIVNWTKAKFIVDFYLFIQIISIAVALATRNSSVCCWSEIKTFSKYGYTRSSIFHKSASNLILTGFSCGVEERAS